MDEKIKKKTQRIIFDSQGKHVIKAGIVNFQIHRIHFNHLSKQLQSKRAKTNIRNIALGFRRCPCEDC